MTQKNEATETKEIRFNFTVEGMTLEQAGYLMGAINALMTLIGLGLGGGFYPYKDEPESRDAVVNGVRFLKKLYANDGDIGIPASEIVEWADEILKPLEASDVQEK